MQKIIPPRIERIERIERSPYTSKPQSARAVQALLKLVMS